MRYLNPRLRFHYFRFLKTNGCLNEILFGFLTHLLSFASYYQTSSKSNNARQSYNVVTIFAMSCFPVRLQYRVLMISNMLLDISTGVQHAAKSTVQELHKPNVRQMCTRCQVARPILHTRLYVANQTPAHLPRTLSR